jgi:hypothetical protein
VVGGDDDAARVWSAFDQLQRAAPIEHAHAVADRDWIDEEVELVDQVVLDE